MLAGSEHLMEVLQWTTVHAIDTHYDAVPVQDIDGLSEGAL